MFPAALGLLADHGQACCKGTCWGLVRSHVALSDPSGPPQSCVCAGGGSDGHSQESSRKRRGVKAIRRCSSPARFVVA